MYYKVHTWLVTQLVVSIHPSMERYFTLTGTICTRGTTCTSAECPGGQPILVQIVLGGHSGLRHCY